MAGVLAPQLPDISGADGGFSVSPDVSVGRALENIANIGNMFFSSRRDEGISQTDKDRELLKPFIEKAANFESLRNSVKMSASEYSTRVRSLMKEALTVLPDKSSTVKQVFSVYTGEDFAEPVKSLENEQINAVIDWATDPNNPQGALAMMESIAVDKNGIVDQDATRANLFERYAKIKAQEAEVERLRLEKEKLELGTEITSLVQQSSVEKFVATSIERVQAGLEGVMKTFISSPQTASTIEETVTQLTEMRAQYLNEFTALAANGGILDDIQDKFRNGLDETVVPIDNAIKFVSRLNEESFATLKAMNAKDKILLAQTLNKSGVPASSLFAESDYFMQVLTISLMGDIGTAAKKLELAFKAANESKLDSSIPQTKRVDENGEGSVELSNSIQELSMDEKRDAVKTSLSRFALVDKTTIDNPVIRKVGALEFATLTEVINNSGLPIDEGLFDTVYDPSFIDRYRIYQEAGGEEATILKNSVVKNISKILAQRTIATNTTLSSAVSTLMPGLSVQFNGENFDLAFRGGTPSNKIEKNLIRALNHYGLELSIDGLREFTFVDATSAESFGLSAFEATFRELENNVRFLNKIITFTKKLPEEVFQGVFPDVEKISKQANVVRLPSDDEKEAERLYDSLKDGDQFELILNDGSVITLEKGNELSFFKTP